VSLPVRSSRFIAQLGIFFTYESSLIISSSFLA
jgi:hypothetical protein